ncbi:MAG TPA: TolC family protein [Gemmatimonadales bacterium]|jgi:outer membrane protein TolC|nr:TolC family protein [Gemmatimonadales bacterium]
MAPQRAQLTAADLVVLALERSPDTRATWLAAESAAASLGQAKSALFPEITGTVELDALKTAATAGRVSVQQTTLGPTVTLNWLLLDFGGRSGAIDAARNALFSADWTHNATLSDLVRRTEQGYFSYVGARGLLEAQRATFDQAQVNLAAAEDRRSVGVATIADVLQARTAVAQARLALQDAEGSVASTHGALATLVGLPPTAAFEVDTTAANAPIMSVAIAVDTLIAQALAARPDLAAVRATADQLRAEAREARAQQYPTLALSGSGGTTYIANVTGGHPSYNVGISLNVPLFDGLGWQYAARAAALSADAESARVQSLEREVALEVFQSYQELRTATERVAASNDLFTSASANADAARGRYREGVGSLLELLTAEQALADARSQRIAARVTWDSSLVQLAHDVGSLAPTGAPGLPLAPPPTGSNP